MLLLASTLEPCVLVVGTTPPVDPGGTAPPVVDPGVGLLPDAGGTALVLLALGLALVLVGVGLARRRRAGLGAFSVLPVVLALGLALAVGAPHPVSAATPETGCSLIEVTDVERAGDPEATNLTPGQQVEALGYTVRNVTEFPITLDVATRPDEAGSGSSLAVSLRDGDDTVLASGTLDALPDTGPVRLGPGAVLRVGYQVSVVEGAGNAAQGNRSVFDSVVTATGP